MPVIAYGVGGAAETVARRSHRRAVRRAERRRAGRAIERFEALALDGGEVRENARRFGRERFRAEMAAVIERAADARQASAGR